MSLRRLLPALLAVAVAALPAFADGPVLHEYIEPKPEEDLELRATTADGTMPAAIETPSGVVPAPRRDRPPAAETAYGGSSTPNSIDASYRIDRDTTRPDVVGYDDPFTPSVAPFKRLFAYDAVDESLELTVADKDLEPIEVGGRAEFGDDQFYADLFVDVSKDTPVRIPSVGPGARVLAAHADPAIPIKLYRDGADNWFAEADRRVRVRLMMQLAVQRDVFGSPFAEVSWDRLARQAPRLPPSVQPAADRVLSTIGVSTKQRPREAVAQLIAHFRAFEPSEERPRAPSGAALFEELALSRKGVCRHRAYAFVISALGLGLPARMVRNEAHAWVEVFDGSLWHRVDLGGAAGRMDLRQEPAGQQHQAPGDPYRWPEGSESGAEMADRAMSAFGAPGASGGPTPAGAASGASNAPATRASGTPASEDAEADDKIDEDESRAPAELTVKVKQPDVRRGAPLALEGSVRADGEACGHARVDVSLRTKGSAPMTIGALPTDGDGRFQGSVTVPLDVDVGDYDVVVSTPGAAVCGPGRSE